MAIQKTKRTGPVSFNGISPVGKGANSNTASSFQNTFQGQYSDHYKNRAAALFDEISALAPAIVERADIAEFEKYRRLIRELLDEVLNNAYSVNLERILDRSGRQRIYTTVKIVDSKLEDLAADLLNRNSDRLDFLGRIDEIRGLVMDTLF